MATIGCCSQVCKASNPSFVVCDKRDLMRALSTNCESALPATEQKSSFSKNTFTSTLLHQRPLPERFLRRLRASSAAEQDLADLTFFHRGPESLAIRSLVP